MTERTTPITVHLTDDQIAHPGKYDLNLFDVLCKAIEAQRPRPIAVGDRVWSSQDEPSRHYVHRVLAIDGDLAWCRFGDSETGSRMNIPTKWLTRVDDGEASDE